jgi:hypothetical protein
MAPGVGPAALIFFLPFALASHAIYFSAMRVVPKLRKHHGEERLAFVGAASMSRSFVEMARDDVWR